MPIFISYSHSDKDFVDRLASQLVRNRTYVWLDRWELNVGDSIIARIQEAISSASALLVILSNASVQSEWCKKEMNAGLLRELDERQVVVLPVLLENCSIPLFLRDKLYADFRTNFDDGLRAILEATARISNPSTGRIEETEYHTDWSLDWGAVDGRIVFRVTLLEEAVDQQFTLLSVVSIAADSAADLAYRQRRAAEGEESANTETVSSVVRTVTAVNDMRITLSDQFERFSSYACATAAGNYEVTVSSRRLGVDNGRNVIVDVGSQLKALTAYMRSVMERPPGNAGRVGKESEL